MILNSTIFQKGLILVGIPLVSQLLFLAALLKIRLDQDDAQAWALHTGRVVTAAERLYARLGQTQSAMRGYLVTEDRRFLTQYAADRTALAAGLTDLAALVRDNPAQQARVGEIDAQIGEMAEAHKTLQAHVAAGRRDAVKAEMGRLAVEGHLGDLRRAFDDFLTTETALNADRLAALDRQQVRQDLVVYAGGVLALATTALLGYVFARSLAGRLTVLTENARRLGAGKELLAPLKGRDELARLDRAFRDMADALAHKDRENEMFVYSVSHDLRSPLVNLQGFSQELALSSDDLRGLLAASPDVPTAVRQRAERVLDGGIQEAIGFIQSAVTRLSGIIDALLRLSRAGRVEYRPQKVETGPLVRRVVGALQSTLRQKGAAVTVGDLPAVWGDPTALEQALGNLVGNAAHYLDPARPGRIEVGVAPPAADHPGQHVLYVRDNGLGIPAEHQGKVFLAFQRLHGDHAPGEGIGLTLVRRVVERHGGRIWFDSAPGEGTTFYVALPADAPKET